MGEREMAIVPSAPFETTEANATLFSSLANRGGSVRLASNRRIGPENVGGPASCGNAERRGPHQDLRPLATPAGVGERLPHEDMDPGTDEIDETPQVDAGPDRPSVAQGAAVILSGSGTAPDAGEVLIHAWTQGEHAPTVEDGRKGESSNAIQQDELSRQPGEGVYNP